MRKSFRKLPCEGFREAFGSLWSLSFLSFKNCPSFKKIKYKKEVTMKKGPIAAVAIFGLMILLMLMHPLSAVLAASEAYPKARASRHQFARRSTDRSGA
jgi:hypothetical protein